MKLHLCSADQSVVISIDSFPFTIGRNHPEFLKSDNQTVTLVESIRHISRNHATFSIIGEGITVSDESTLNGTYVNGNKVKDDPLHIFSGDVISLASKFELTVFVENPLENSGEKSSIDELTVYADEATVFMNVVSEKISSKDGENYDNYYEDNSNKIINSNRVIGLNLKSFFPSWQVNAAILSVVLFIFLSFIYYRSGSQYKVKNYLEEDKFNQALNVSNEYLAVNSKMSMHDFGKKALMHIALPELMIFLGNDNYVNFKDRLKSLEGSAQNINGSDLVIDTLLFIAQTEYLFKKNTLQQGIGDENWKNEIRSINKKWREKKHLFHPIIDELEQVNSEFINAAALFFSHINESRELELYEIAQLDKLENEVGTAVKEGRYGKVDSLLKEYGENHPNLQAGQDLQRDVEAYVLLEEIAETRNAAEACAVISNLTLQTKVLKGLAEEYIQANYPSENILRQLSEASQAWEDGQAQETLKVMAEIPDNPWSGTISERIKTYKAMVALMEVLDKDADDSEKCSAVYGLYKLDGEGGGYYKKRYEREFERCRNGLELKVNANLAEAKDLYGKYTQQGGITGQMRMEQEISNRYRSQAALLAGAYLEASKAEAMVLGYGDELSEQLKEELSVITVEYIKQQSRLTESTVLSDGLKQMKIDLLQQGKDPGDE